MRYYLFYKRDVPSHVLHVYVDASWSDDVLTRMSTTGILVYIGEHLVDWSSKTQSMITHSTAKAEYVSADSAAHMVVWFRALLMNFD